MLHTKSCCEVNEAMHTTVLQQTWGLDCAEAILKANHHERCDLIIMADVLYHCTDFLLLIQTIVGCASECESDVIICYEKRRKNLDYFFELFEEITQASLVKVYIYSVIGQVAIDARTSTEVKFYLYHYKFGR